MTRKIRKDKKFEIEDIIRDGLGDDFDPEKINQVVDLFEEMMNERADVIEKFEDLPETQYNKDQCICDLGEVNEKYFLKMAEVLGRENFVKVFELDPEAAALMV